MGILGESIKGSLSNVVPAEETVVSCFKYNFKYDDKGNKTEWIQTGYDSSAVGRIVYKYDEKNNLIEQTEYGKDNKLKAAYTYSYEFDKKSNWTWQKKIQNGSVIEIKETNLLSLIFFKSL